MRILSSTITDLTAGNDPHVRMNNHSRARWRKDNPARTRYDHVPTTFICVDGEGVTLPDGTHKYVLLGVGDQQVTNPDGLTFEEIADFLWEQFSEHGSKSVAYTGFFLGYDFCQWLRSLPSERASMLLSPEGQAKRKPKSGKRVQPFPVRYGDWEFDLLGNKRFKLRKTGASRWMYICDAGGFFQKSFLKVINPSEWSDPVVTQPEYEAITEGKARRSTAILDSNMLHYNAKENQVLARVLERLNTGFQSLGIHLRPGQWFGPGQAAQAWLDGRAITAGQLAEVTPRAVLESARMSYFGGWFEIMAHGLIPGITHEYDINSAYPYIISQLPCLEHGQWAHKDSIINWNSPYTLVYARVQGDNPYIGAMLHRDRKGNIYRPHQTEGWYWLHELNAAGRAGLASSAITGESWSYTPCDCTPPLREVANIYKLRKEVGKKTPLGIACKLVPNSLYGKFAQSVGSPKFANPVYASLITAGCRTMILNAIATHPAGAKDVMMVATDGVYFRTPHPNLPVTGNLGDWDHAEKTNMTLFKPGVYWDDKARKAIRNNKPAEFKARGVNARELSKRLKQIDFLFSPMMTDAIIYNGMWPKIEFPVDFTMISAKQALILGDWSLAGTLLSDPTGTQSSNPQTKRQNPYQDGEIIRTEPRANMPYEPSCPYEKRFGMEDPYSQETLESGGITPDGYPGQTFREVMGI